MPLEADDIVEIIDDVAAADKSVTSNGRSITAHDLDSLIALEKHRRQQEAETSSPSRAGFGLRFQQITPTYR